MMETQILVPYSVVIMPTISPVVPVIAPTDRSNSPPIIKSAPATASTPKSEEEYNHVETPAVDKNAVVVLEKYVNIRSAATAAPTSGRRKIRANRPDMICRSSFWVLTVVMV